MEKRVYGVLGISSIMANWNADFTGQPKRTSDGNIFGSDKAFKYPMKKAWDSQGKKVLYIKSYKFSEGKKGEVTLVPQSLSERYESIFQVKSLKDAKNTKEVLENLFQAVDVKNFGATFAEGGNNVSITGAVQIGQGFNKYKGSEVEEQQILSPFRDGTQDATEKGEAKNSTLGTKIVSNEAHYFYPFVINPLAYQEYVSLGVTQGYTEEDYQVFKQTAIEAATSYATNAKVGCENEFALFVECDKNLYLPNLSEYITFEKGKKEEKNTITLHCDQLLNELSDRIQSIEIYYNTYTSQLKHETKQAKCYDIITQKEV